MLVSVAHVGPGQDVLTSGPWIRDLRPRMRGGEDEQAEHDPDANGRPSGDHWIEPVADGSAKATIFDPGAAPR